jgi:hypothetical protein
MDLNYKVVNKVLIRFLVEAEIRIQVLICFFVVVVFPDDDLLLFLLGSDARNKQRMNQN